MFTGIIQAIGRIRNIRVLAEGDLHLAVESSGLGMKGVALGDSIAVNGVCLTVTELLQDGFAADVSFETLEHTRIAELKSGDRVNLEKALTLSTPLGGHLVSGHVDGVGSVTRITPSGRSTRYWVDAPAELSRYIALKGSVTIDGVSLTVNETEGNSFCLNIVPHSAENTLFAEYRTGSRVHIEVDLLARYLERLMQGTAPEQTGSSSSLTLAALAKAGFVKP